MPPTPILFISDSPELPTGLARIARDLATLLSSLPEFRVGFMGMGGVGSRQLPFTTYSFPQNGLWGSDVFEDVWEDFSPYERGVVFTNWDITRVTWLAGILPDSPLRSFIQQGRFQRWGYFPIDSTGPGGRLTGLAAESMKGFERILTPTKWASDVVKATVDHTDVDWIPHGINLTAFTPQDRIECRRAIFSPKFADGDKVVGVVASNQARKDWGLVAQVCRGLSDADSRFKFWWHTDTMERSWGWSIPALIADYGLAQDVMVSTNRLSDTQMGMAYNGCDVTIHPGLGEGFGFPIAESLACGVPAIHGEYGGGAELIQDPKWKIRVMSTRVEGIHNSVRPIYDEVDWIETVLSVVAAPPRVEDSTSMVQHLGWKSLWPVWKRWFLKGIR